MARKSARLERLYQSRRWRTRSRQHRDRHPFCVRCEEEAAAKGQISDTLARLCHHIGDFDEKRMSDAEFWLMPIEGLCHRHHEIHHGRNPPCEYSNEIGINGFHTDPNHPHNQPITRKAKP